MSTAPTPRTLLATGDPHGRMIREALMRMTLRHAGALDHVPVAWGVSGLDSLSPPLDSYTNTRCFETFPFPDGLTPSLPAAGYAHDPRAIAIAEAARALVAARDRWLNPPEWVERVPEIVPGLPDRLVPKDAKSAALLRKRTLTALYNTRFTPEGAWLDALHAALDAAVARAYGWPEDIAAEDALARLLALNQARAGGAAA